MKTLEPPAFASRTDEAVVRFSRGVTRRKFAQ